MHTLFGCAHSPKVWSSYSGQYHESDIVTCCNIVDTLTGCSSVGSIFASCWFAYLKFKSKPSNGLPVAVSQNGGRVMTA